MNLQPDRLQILRTPRSAISPPTPPNAAPHEAPSGKSPEGIPKPAASPLAGIHVLAGALKSITAHAAEKGLEFPAVDLLFELGADESERLPLAEMNGRWPAVRALKCQGYAVSQTGHLHLTPAGADCITQFVRAAAGKPARHPAA